jgi:hypothetical protein
MHIDYQESTPPFRKRKIVASRWATNPACLGGQRSFRDRLALDASADLSVPCRRGCEKIRTGPRGQRYFPCSCRASPIPSQPWRAVPHRFRLPVPNPLTFRFLGTRPRAAARKRVSTGSLDRYGNNGQYRPISCYNCRSSYSMLSYGYCDPLVYPGNCLP